jgi:hypothetical protein
VRESAPRSPGRLPSVLLLRPVPRASPGAAPGTRRARGARPPCDAAASRLRQSLRVSCAEGVLAEVISACAGVTALTGWALHLGAGPLEVALVGALPQLAQVIQVPGAFVTAALGRRRVAIVAVAASRAALLPLAALPFLPLSAAGARAMLVSIAALSAVLGVVGNNAWTSWMGELVPAPLVGRYFGRRTALLTLGGTFAGVAVARVLDGAAGPDAAAHVLAALAGIAALVGVATTALMARQHDPGGAAPPRPPLASALRPARDPAGRALLRYTVAWNASVGIAGGFFTFHLLHDLGAGFTVAALHAATSALVRTAVTPAWGRAVDRLGARPVLAACSFPAAVLPLLWLAAGPGRLWPIAVDAVVGGIAWGGHGIAAFALPLAVSPRRERPFYLAAVAAAGGLAYALAIVAGGALAVALPRAVATLGRSSGHGLELLFVASAVGRLGSALLALRIPERGAGSLAALHRDARGAALARIAVARARVPRLPPRRAPAAARRTVLPRLRSRTASGRHATVR